MRAENLTTLTKIRKAAKAEFLAKGFKSASLRNIVKTAGLTTGAFYGYYGSKEELFCALVDEPYHVFMERYRQAQEAFACLPPACQQENMGEISGQCMDWMGAYVYENYDAFKLLLCCAEGTKYENMVHDMVEIEVRATHRFMEVLRSLGRKILRWTRSLSIFWSAVCLQAFLKWSCTICRKKKRQLSSGSCAHFTWRAGKKLWGFNPCNFFRFS